MSSEKEPGSSATPPPSSEVSPSTASRLPEMWEQFQEKMAQIDQLEQRLDEQANRMRRRMTNLLDHTDTHRRSHMRMFVTHTKVDDSETSNTSGEATISNNSSNSSSNSDKWNLIVEGRPLVGQLDFESAAQTDKDGGPHHLVKAAEGDTPLVSPKDVSETPEPGSAKFVFKSVGDNEEDPVKAVQFTHFFSKAWVSFRTIYQPLVNPAKAAMEDLAPPKKARSNKRKTPDPLPEPVAQVDPKYLTPANTTTNLVWARTQTADAHAFRFEYNDTADPPHDKKRYSVVATVNLIPIRPIQMFKPNKALAGMFFPFALKDQDRAERKRQKMENGPTREDLIPLDNEIYVPSLLTLQEIDSAIFQYVQEKRLQDATDKSLVVCDTKLTSLFQVESFNFSQLESMLLSRELIRAVGPEEDPIELTYIMSPSSVAPQAPRTAPVPGTIQQVLSFDMDVYIPSLFPNRARDLMRKIKRREFEYTSSRTKARYMLVASKANEDKVRTQIEQVVSGRGYNPDNVPVYLALARSAPKFSEARASAQTDARICTLLQKIDEQSREAEDAWDLVEACRNLGSNV